ncbi:PREDICTED: uncharacterized protein LOC109480394 [Branchiostoma belcheri]|uniref:Uncharacterized protein LOC109480394 n=1 Tax=Branchiostoma belcheri TaxID=7741 RepID=A0A6P5A4M3_BRABE|nr:PREDICTED: uncharacterized protein LOC109480394 [Branchiostoma belcheri]
MSSRRPSQFETGAAVVLMVNGMTGSVRQTTMNDLRLDYGLRVLEPAAGQPDSGQGSDTSPPSPRLPPGHTHGDHDIDEAISPLQLSQEDSLSVDVLSVPQTPWPEKDPAPGPHVRSNWRPGAWTWVGYGADPKSEPLAMRGANPQLQAQPLVVAADLQPQEQAGPQSTRLQRSPGLRPADMLAPTHGSPIYRTLLYEGTYVTGVSETRLSVNVSALYAGPVSPTYTVTLRWDGGSLAERLYKVSPAQLGSSLVEYEAVGLEPGRPYRGEIWAVRADGEERLAYLFMAKTSSR